MNDRRERWKQARREVGLCERCGKRRNTYARFCDECQAKNRARYIRFSKQKESKAWEFGKRGRVPFKYAQR